MKKSGLKKRYWIIPGIILIIAALLFAAPRFARWYAVKKSPELIGRKLTIEKIRLNYFTGTFQINDLKLFEADSNTVFLSFKQMKIAVKFLPLFKKEISAKNFSLDDPYIEVLQNGDKFNFSSLLTSELLTSKKDTIPSKPVKYTIYNIRINSGSAKYSDERLNNTIAIDQLDLLIPGFTWHSDSTKLGLDLRFVKGGGLSSNLALNLVDSTYSFKLKLDSLNLDIIEPYVHRNMHISALHGYLSNDILVEGNMNSIMQMFVRGVNHIFDFQLIDTLKRPVLSFKDLTVDIDSLRPDRNSISLKYIGLTNPDIIFEMIDSSDNWLALIKPIAATRPDTLKQQSGNITASAEGSYTFSKLLISGGKVHFADKTLRYPFDYTIDNLKLESSPVSNTGKFKFNISAGLNGTGNFTADATLNPYDLHEMDIAFSINQFRMKDMDAYFKHFFGFPVTGGIMKFRTEDKLGATTLVSNNTLYLRKFTLGESRIKDSKYHIPLRLAIGILSDKDGIIDLKAPVEMKGEEVKIRNLGKIIFGVIGDLFVKAAISPVKMLSGLFKIDPARLQEITLGLSEPSPDEKNLKSVDVIADILTRRPNLNIDFIYCIDIKKTTDTLAYILTADDYFKNSKSTGVNNGNIADSSLIKYLVSRDSTLAAQGTGNLSQLCRSYIGDQKLSMKIDSLKTMQTDFMMNYLSHDKAIPSDRFRIIGTAPDTIKYEVPEPAFRIYFTASGEKQEQ